MSQRLSVSCRVSDGTASTFDVPAGLQTLHQLLQAIQQGCSTVQQNWVITDGQRTISSDADVQQLQQGCKLQALPPEMSVFTERVSFNPHPKTLTMAGDYEYFAAQGHHPLAFALGELIDNALRATKSNGMAGAQGSSSSSGKPRDIIVTLLTNSRSESGLICVADNGCGMTPKELNQWAVMNLSMEDRGLLQNDMGQVGNRYLSSDISYFGVGSKNAAFYLGNTVKVVTRQAGSSFVHELCIQGKELERRYKEGAAVYEEDMVHRAPGAANSLTTMEQNFAWPQQLLAQEATDAGSSSFTRVLIGDLRPDVLSQLQQGDGPEQLIRDLAHLYHYYLHGAEGNNFTNNHQTRLPTGEAVPTIKIQLVADETELWSKDLRDVNDDVESLYLKWQRNQLDFALEVPNQGLVEGMLWYFPYENDQETVPLDAHTLSRMQLAAATATQVPDPGAVGGLPVGPSLRTAQQTQAATARATQQGVPGAEAGAAEKAAAAFLQSAPIFETFWQGRLIPGTCVDTLPFIEAVRSRRSAAQKDLLPDEVFRRMRGALFFGPSFKVTRNKLTFRDNLPALLATSHPTDRKLDKRFKDWLVQCHTMDRTIRFERIANQAEQAAVRQRYGESVTLFESITDGAQVISRGDIIKLSCKPAIMGKVWFFSVPQAVTSEGCYSFGQVTVAALPEAVHGVVNHHTWPLRRLEGLASEAEAAEFVAKELKKLPSRLVVEPIKLTAGGVLEVPAGSTLSQSTVKVLNSSNQRITKSFYDGEKHTLRVAQALYYLGDQAPAQAAPPGVSNQVPQAGQGKGSSKAAKRSRKANKGAAAAAAAAEEAAAAQAGAAAGAPDKENTGSANAQLPSAGHGTDGSNGKASSSSSAQQQVQRIVLPPSAEAVLLCENKTPIHEEYKFQKITGGLTRTGYYCLRYALLPEVPGSGGLYVDVVIHAAAGPPVAFQIQGMARALAQARPFVLGECLPPLTLTFTDVNGNPCRQPPDQDKVGMELLAGSLAAGGTVLPDLQIAGEMVTEDGQLCVKGLQITAIPGISSGLDYFCSREKTAAAGAGDQEAPGSSGALAQQQDGASGPLAVKVIPTLEAHLAVIIEGMESQSFPVRVCPGAPHHLQLLAGHPFTGEDMAEEELMMATQLLPGTQLAADLPAAKACTGQSLPSFKVRVLDVWGNPTCPTEELPFSVHVDCDGLQPNNAVFEVDCRGVVAISGLTAGPGNGTPLAAAIGATQGHSRMYPLLLAPSCAIELVEEARNEDAEGMAAAVVAAGQVQPLKLSLAVEPSTLPATMVVVYQGEALPERQTPAAAGEELGTTWLLHGVTAGSRVSGLALRCLDEVGRPAATPVKGRVQVSWARGSKKVHLGPQDVQVPPVPVPEACGAPASLWLRFVGDPKEWPDTCLEVNLEVQATPGPPASWGMSLLAFDPEQQARPPADQQQAAGEQSVQCGVPFYLELEALDAFHNRCRLSPGDLLTPQVEAQPLDADAGPLQLDPASWNYRWDQTQAGGDVCLYKMWLAGAAGPVKLLLRDTAGEDGASLLAPEELQLQLLAGPAATLLLTGPTPQLQVSSHVALPSLGVSVADDWGNTVESSVFEVLLQTSALSAEDESAPAAKVSAAGSNRVKLRNGVASFRNVRLSADLPGPYLLRVEPLSRKVTVRQGTLLVQLVQQNVVRELLVQPCSLPADGSSAVGQSLTPVVAVTTEDGQAVPWEVLCNSLSLVLSMPCPGGAAASSGSSKKSKVRPAEVIPLAPDRVASQAANEAAAAAVAASQQDAAMGQEQQQQQQPRGCLVCFTTPTLTLAGGYTLTAEYREGREELVAQLSKQDLAVRSPSVQLQLLPGPPVNATLEGPSAAVTSLTISNSASGADRCLLRQVAVQLRDSHHNPCTAAGLKVRWLLLPESGEVLDPSQEETPQVVFDGVATEAVTDDSGRVFFGDMMLKEGAAGLAAGRTALRCTLSLQVGLPRAPGAGGSSKRKAGSSSDTWTTTWSCDVLYSDDTSRVQQLQELSARCQQLQQQLAGLKAEHASAEERLQAAEKAAAAASSAASRELQGCEVLLGPVLQHLQLAPELPCASKELQQLLEQVQQMADQLPAREAQCCRFGAPNSAVTRSLQRCLDSGDAEVVGVLAQLGMVQDTQLSALLAATLGGRLQTLVVESYEASQRLKKMLSAANLYVPNMLPRKLIQAFRPESEGGAVKMRGMPKHAQELQADAAKGSDPPLPLLLPHTRVLKGGKGPRCSLAADEWPDGCLGYAVNLIRPAMKGIRGNILYSQVGRTLVFETLDAGAAYRQLVTQVLRASLSEVVTLDGGRLAGSGVISGSGFQVVPLEQAPCCFGGSDSGAGGAASPEVHTSALEGAIAALQEQEAADAEVAEAKEALEQLQADPAQQQVPQLEEHLVELEAARQQQEQQLAGVLSLGRQQCRSCGPSGSDAQQPPVVVPGSQEQPGGEEAAEQAAGGGEGKRPSKKKRHA